MLGLGGQTSVTGLSRRLEILAVGERPGFGHVAEISSMQRKAIRQIQPREIAGDGLGPGGLADVVQGACWNGAAWSFRGSQAGRKTCQTMKSADTDSDSPGPTATG